MDSIDWAEINNSKSVNKSYKAIDWSKEDISASVASNLNWEKVDFTEFNPDKLDDINDLGFDTLGKNYKKLKWDLIDYSKLSTASKNIIEWDKVNLKKAAKSSSFSLDIVDWAEINNSKSVNKSYKAIDQTLLNNASVETLSLLKPSHLNSKLISSKLFFSKDPKNMGDFTNKAGTSDVDKITGLSGEAIFAGSEDDILISKNSYASATTSSGVIKPSFLSGGDGNDTYKVKKGSTSIIYDIGNGNDTLNINSISIDAQSWLLDDIQGIFITDSKTSVLVIKGSEIEKIKFGGKTYIQPDAPFPESLPSSLSNLKSQGILNLNSVSLNSDQSSLNSFINDAIFNNGILI